MTVGKAATAFVAYAMAFVIAVAGFTVPASSAYASQQNLQAGTVQAQALKAQAQSDMNTFGIDVSQWQGSIDWARVAEKVEYAVIRCGYGNNSRSQDDTRWLTNVQGCREAGIPMGVYLYSYARNATQAKSEAKHVIRCLREAGLDASSLELPIYLDMEDSSTNGLTPAKYAKIFKAFQKKLNNAGYNAVGVYANCSWWDGNLSKIALESELRWVAHWNKTLFAGYPGLAEKGCGVWQYGDAKVDGISGRVDANYARDDWSYLGGVADEEGDEAEDGEAANNNESEFPFVYKMYMPGVRDYLYTTDSDEVAILKRSGWKEKGTLGQVPRESSVPVYRFYNGSKRVHFYTTKKSTFNKLAKSRTWAYEGVAFYSARTAEGTPVYCLRKSKRYQYVGTAASRDKLVMNSGWAYKGIGWYAAQSQD